MRFWSRIILILTLGLTVTMHFTSCDVYSDSSLFTTMSSSCEGEDCYVQSSDFLELRINSSSEMKLAATTMEFEIGGDCNEGGFPDNEIIWEIFSEGTVVQRSSSLSVIIRCEMGRFKARVVLPATRLCVAGTAKSHTLEVEIIGRDKDGRVFTNPMVGRKIIYLVPQTPYSC